MYGKVMSAPAYCLNPSCELHEHGFNAKYVTDGWHEPGYAIDEECPECFDAITDERVGYENPVDGLLDELWQAFDKVDAPWLVPEGMKVDRRKVYAVVFHELRRQAAEHRRSQREHIETLKEAA